MAQNRSNLGAQTTSNILGLGNQLAANRYNLGQSTAQNAYNVANAVAAGALGLGQAGAQSAYNIGNAQATGAMNAGQARASGYVGAANAINQGIGSVANYMVNAPINDAIARYYSNPANSGGAGLPAPVTPVTPNNFMYGGYVRTEA